MSKSNEQPLTYESLVETKAKLDFMEKDSLKCLGSFMGLKIELDPRMSEDEYKIVCGFNVYKFMLNNTRSYGGRDEQN